MIARLYMIVLFAAGGQGVGTSRAPLAQAAASAGPVRPVVAGDSAAALIRRARRAETKYELLARIRAPVTFTSGSGDHCDEIVGRFCLHFDSDDEEKPPTPEPAAAVTARVEAVAALERAAAYVPGERRTARALVRLLVESRRDSAAVEAARRHASAAPGVWAELLLGFALHAAGDDTAAEGHFSWGLSALPERERRRLRLDAQLSPPEAAAMRKLAGSARQGYEAALWKLGDPLYLTPGNEVRGEYLARYVWGRMLAEVPLVRGMTTWGDDLEELTARYGVPRSRERVPARSFEGQDGLVEHYDQAQLPFLPESLLTVGVRPTPPPGEKWALDDPRARSGFAPVTVRRMVRMPVQVTRFPAGDSVVLRVDGALPLDSVARGAAGADAGLFILPSPEALLQGDTAVLRATAATAPALRDTAWLTLSVALPPGRYVYSAEALDRSTRLAARARYLVELPAPPPDSAPLLSDVLLAHAFARRLPARRDDPVLRALAEPVVSAGDTLGLYAEAGRLAGTGPYRVQLELGPAGPASALARLGGWLRERLGGSAPEQGIRAAWTADAPPAGETAPVALATDLVVPRLAPGLYVVRLDLTGASGASATTRRLLRVLPSRRP